MEKGETETQKAIEAEVLEQIKNDARQYSKDVSFGTYSEGYLQSGYEVGAKTYFIAGRSKALEEKEKRMSGADFEIGNALAVLATIDSARNQDAIIRIEKYLIKAKQLLNNH